MTREEAIEIIKKLIPTQRRADGQSTTHLMITIALDMAIKALEQEPIDDMRVSVRPDSNGWYPNVCGMCINNESELCDSCEYNSNFKKETSKPSFYKKGKIK